MVHPHQLALILQAYPAISPVKSTFAHTAGGFSGARLWRVSSVGGEFALRRWPVEHPSPERLEWIHSLLRHITQQGLTIVPVPVENVYRKTYLPAYGHLWEVVPWLAGTPLESPCSDHTKIRAAAAALARFHQAAASFRAGRAEYDTSPALRSRHEQLQRLIAGEAAQLYQSISADVWPAGVAAAKTIAQLFPLAGKALEPQLATAARLRVPLQACLRDVWSDHLLFEGDQVRGLIDFGAARIESPAGDVARLLGSLAADNPQAWSAGIAAYQSVRPLSETELQLLEAFDRSTVVMAGWNWIAWIYRDRRRFSDLASVAWRLEHYAERLAVLVQKLRG